MFTICGAVVVFPSGGGCVFIVNNSEVAGWILVLKKGLWCSVPLAKRTSLLIYLKRRSLFLPCVGYYFPRWRKQVYPKTEQK